MPLSLHHLLFAPFLHLHLACSHRGNGEAARCRTAPQVAERWYWATPQRPNLFFFTPRFFLQLCCGCIRELMPNKAVVLCLISSNQFTTMTDSFKANSDMRQCSLEDCKCAEIGLHQIGSSEQQYSTTRGGP
jgi:hypothetical protein